MKTFFVASCLFIFFSISAQKFDCSSKIAAYQEFYQSKNCDKALTIWNEVAKNCPKENETIYSEGIQIYQYKIDNSQTEIDKEKLIRDVLKLYDLYHKNFPESTEDVAVRKAMYLYNYSEKAKQQMEEVNSLLEIGFATAPKKISDPNAFYLYFKMYNDAPTVGENGIGSEKKLEKYMLVNALLSDLETNYPEKSLDYRTARNGIKALAKELVTCDELAKYYEKNFEANKENEEWLKNAFVNLDVKCGSKPIYYSLAKAYYDKKATTKSAYFMGIASVKQRKLTEAAAFFTEAETLETNPLEKAKIDYSLASGLLSNDKPKSKELLLKALALDPKMGKAYLFLGQSYANSANDCGNTDFEKKAVYYLANQTFKKASEAEPRLKPSADKMIEKYAPQALTSKDISDQKLNGKTFTIGCWINETISFPSK